MKRLWIVPTAVAVLVAGYLVFQWQDTDDDPVFSSNLQQLGDPGEWTLPRREPSPTTAYMGMSTFCVQDEPVTLKGVKFDLRAPRDVTYRAMVRVNDGTYDPVAHTLDGVPDAQWGPVLPGYGSWEQAQASSGPEARGLAGKTHDLDGYVVSTHCPADPTTVRLPQVEIIVELSVDEQGGWLQGARVAYEDLGGDTHELPVRFQFVICGNQNPVGAAKDEDRSLTYCQGSEAATKAP